MSRMGLCISAAALTSLTVSISAHGAPDNAYANEPRARISTVEGGELTVKGPFDQDEIVANQNMVVREGDVLTTSPDARVEVELPNGNFLRMDGQTTARLSQLDGNVEIELNDGSAYLSRGNSRGRLSGISFAGQIETTPKSLVRIDVAEPRGRMDVVAVSGNIDVMTDDGTVDLPEHTAASYDSGHVRQVPWSHEQEDAFDKWSQAREVYVRGYQAPAYVSNNNYDGLYDLQGNGEWIDVDGRQQWRPTHVAAGWRPYEDGYWSWVDPYGWTWVPATSWGYVTHHYGRWSFSARFGWSWYPVAAWGPAWVSWASFDDQVGWAPIDYYGRPVYVVTTTTYYDPAVWVFASNSYFSYGGGYTYTYRYGHHRGTRVCAGTRSRAWRDAGSAWRDTGHGRPIYRMDRDRIARHGRKPLRDPHRDLRPRGHADNGYRDHGRGHGRDKDRGHGRDHANNGYRDHGRGHGRDNAPGQQDDRHDRDDHGRGNGNVNGNAGGAHGNGNGRGHESGRGNFAGERGNGRGNAYGRETNPAREWKAPQRFDRGAGRGVTPPRTTRPFERPETTRAFAPTDRGVARFQGRQAEKAFSRPSLAQRAPSARSWARAERAPSNFAAPQRAQRAPQNFGALSRSMRAPSATRSIAPRSAPRSAPAPRVSVPSRAPRSVGQGSAAKQLRGAFGRRN